MAETPNNRNMMRWVGVLLVSFGCGCFACLSESSVSFLDILRHGGFACMPSLLALKVTLEKGLGISDR